MPSPNPTYWLVQPLGRRRFYSRAEAERIARIIQPIRKVHVVAYNHAGKVVQDG